MDAPQDSEEGEKSMKDDKTTILLQVFSCGFEKFLYRKKLKIADVAKELDLTNSAVSSWKHGKSFPDFIKLYNLLQLGMTTDEMFGDANTTMSKENEPKLNILLKDLQQCLNNYFNGK